MNINLIKRSGNTLSNTISFFEGTEEERGLRSWRRKYDVSDTRSADDDTTYDIPFIMGCLRRQKWARYIPFLPTFNVNIRNIFRKCCCKSSKQKAYDISS